MPNHYSDIGFTIKSTDDLRNMLRALMPAGKIERRWFCRYWLITVDAHIEFWQHMKSRNALTSFEMHYGSSNSFTVKFDRWTNLRKDRAAGTACVWFDDLFPIIVDMPNAGFHRHLKKGQSLHLQVACFAEELDLFDTDAAYGAAQAGDGMQYAAEFFIPIGTFSAEGKAKDPSADALFAGHIVSFEKRTNSFSGQTYFHFVVTCQGALFDVVADSALVTADPAVGGILKTACWISGKITR